MNKPIIRDYNLLLNNSLLTILYGQLLIGGIQILIRGWTISSKLLMLMLLKSLFKKALEILSLPIDTLKKKLWLKSSVLAKRLSNRWINLNPTFH